jgi:D-alanyl-D-alanine carboxypeptidase (penicillin-binding protein 5/6)
MTMLLIVEDIESGKLSLDDVVTASQRAASFGGSCVYLEQGEQMTVREMLKCIAVVSANDCAVAMAEHISGSESLFVERMNRRAQELGMEDTHFTSCSGLFDDGKHYTTAYDVAVMSRELIHHDIIKEFTTIWMDSIRDGDFELSNTNKLVYWYPGCTGLKTGYTSTAKYCLAATAMRDGVEYIAVVMHAESSDSRNKDAETLLDVAFANYSLCPLTMEQELPKLAVELGRSDSLSLSYGGERYALVASGSQERSYSLQLPEKVQSPVHEGDTVGTLRVSLGGQEVAAVPIVAAETVERIGFWGMLGLLGGSLFGL